VTDSVKFLGLKLTKSTLEAATRKGASVKLELLPNMAKSSSGGDTPSIVEYLTKTTLTESQVA